jgi:hypothetical protein
MKSAGRFFGIKKQAKLTPMGRWYNSSDAVTPRPPVLRLVLILVAVAGCSNNVEAVRTPAAVIPIAARSPGDDGRPSKGGANGKEHSAALEQLRIAPLAKVIDRYHTFNLLLPDQPHWTRVNFWSVKTAAGFRYGKAHHGLVTAFVREVDDTAQDPRACVKEFERWAKPRIDTFEVDVELDKPTAFAWRNTTVEVQSARARVATLAMNEDYAAAYAAYPAWKGHCLVVGIAIPGKDDIRRAVQVRDRFVAEVLPRVEVIADHPPKESY